MSASRLTGGVLLLVLVALLAAVPARADEEEAPLNPSVLGGLEFRELGPALTSGRISDIAVHPDDPYTFWVAYASGGLFGSGLGLGYPTPWVPVAHSDFVFAAIAEERSISAAACSRARRLRMTKK